jgi:hypothetical protein
MSVSEHPISFSPAMRVLLTVLLAGPGRCRVAVSEELLEVRMGLGGWAFAARIPRSSIVAAESTNRTVLAWGAHGWGGRWLVNGSSKGLVQLTIEPRAAGHCLFVPLRLRQLTLSLEEPERFVAALRS